MAMNRSHLWDFIGRSCNVFLWHGGRATHGNPLLVEDLPIELHAAVHEKHQVSDHVPREQTSSNVSASRPYFSTPSSERQPIKI